MEQWLYVMFIEKTKTYNRLTRAAVERHVANLKALDDSGHLELCGVFKGYPGVAGMYILRADSFEEAEALCRQEPLVLEGFATYKLTAMQPANRDNTYLL